MTRRHFKKWAEILKEIKDLDEKDTTTKTYGQEIIEEIQRKISSFLEKYPIPPNTVILTQKEATAIADYLEDTGVKSANSLVSIEGLEVIVVTSAGRIFFPECPIVALR